MNAGEPARLRSGLVCAAINGVGLDADQVTPQGSAERGTHDHPDWAYLVSDIELK